MVKRHRIGNQADGSSWGVRWCRQYGDDDAIETDTVCTRGVLNVVTINHGLRTEFKKVPICGRCSQKLSLPVTVIASTQEGAKLASNRSKCPSKCPLQFQTDQIATAHHQDDQVETVLYRFLRGSGTIGLSGLAPLNRPWCRPILCLTKEDILSYATSNRIHWFEDPSNQESLRGRVRQILPELNELHGGAVRALVRSSQICAYDDSVLTKIVDDNWTRVFSGNRLITEEILTFQPGLRCVPLPVLFA